MRGGWSRGAEEDGDPGFGFEMCEEGEPLMSYKRIHHLTLMLRPKWICGVSIWREVLD